MATYGGSNIVLNGLVLNLDASNSKSYTSASGTWNDLSGNNNTTLFTPGSSSFTAFSSTLNGIRTSCTSSISYANSNNTSQIIWYYWSGTNVANAICGLCDVGFGLNGIGLWINDGSNSANIGNKVSIMYPGSKYNASSQFGTLIANQWTQLVLIRDTVTTYLYQNSILVATTSLSPLAGTVKNVVFNATTGNGGLYQVYNRVITQQEISQNYNALKSRFNL